MVRYLSNNNPNTNSGSGGGDLPTDPTFSSVQSTGTIAAQGIISSNASIVCSGLAVNGVSNHNSLSNFTAPIDASGQTMQISDVVASTFKASTIQPKHGDDETLVVQANVLTRPVGSTLQVVADQITASGTISTSSYVAAGTVITANSDIVSATGKIEATNGALIGNSGSITNGITCGSLSVSNGLFDDQELQVPRLNLSTGPHDGWTLQQGANASDQQDTLAFIAPNANATFNILDDTGNPLLIQSSSGLISQTEMNQNGNFTLSSNSLLKFGGYVFNPKQFTRSATISIRSTPDRASFTNMIFNCRSTSDFVNVNSGQTQSMYNAALEGIYKLSVSQNGASSATSYNMVAILFDYVLRLSTQSTPDIIPSVSYGYRIQPSGALPPTVEVDHLNTPIQSQPVYLNFPSSNSAAGETIDVTIRLTQMPW